ncbi:MAG: hypothetical protein JWM51_1126, partial [Microbacteriaceae bacterium]|nr:hypothetical protein [Microbacteriaceae bacterium]
FDAHSFPDAQPFPDAYDEPETPAFVVEESTESLSYDVIDENDVTRSLSVRTVAMTTPALPVDDDPTTERLDTST